MTDITEINKKIKDQLNWIEEDYNVDLWRDCFEITKLCLEHTIEALEDLSKDFNAIKEDVDSFADEEELTLDLTIVKYKKQLEELKTRNYE